jgi:hypothetical protein
MLLAAQDPARLPAVDPPGWVAEWLSKRSESAARKKDRADRPAAAPDPLAQARRAERRTERVLAGIEALDLWMSDLVRTGFAAAQGDQPFREQAARLVDAQAPGLAGRVRQLGNLPQSTPEFAARMADGLGRLALLTHAFRRLDALHPALAADVRAAIGWTVEREEVVAAGERVTDQWAVVGQTVEEDERLRVQRTWLHGLSTQRAALILQFAAGGGAFAEAVPAGTVFGAELAFWPSAYPVRALVTRREGEVRTFVERPAGLVDVEGLLRGYADALARQPWLYRLPAALGDVVPLVVDASTFSLVDGAGRTVPVVGSSPWMMLAVSGGHPIDLFGEWNGRVFAAHGAMAEGRFHNLGVSGADE